MLLLFRKFDIFAFVLLLEATECSGRKRNHFKRFSLLVTRSPKRKISASKFRNRWKMR